MPLPPALAARLAKRGIIKTQEPDKNSPQPLTNEEIIAEDYDDKAAERGAGKQERFWAGIEGVNVDPIKGHKGCPNKSNIYHECTSYCVKTWKQGQKVPDEDYLENKRKILEIWPLPAGWEEVYDEGSGQHYFWNVSNNLVSWLPPSHPNANVTESAAHLREERLLKEGDESEDSSDSDQEVPQQPTKENQKEKKKNKDRERPTHHHRDKKRSRVKDNDLDPMDPASYSDIPRGNWTAGLDAHVKTGVDTTASGQLFQMRPYPAPGAVLAANRSKQPSPPPN